MATLGEVKLDALNTLGFTSGSLNERELAWLVDYTSVTGLTMDEQWNLLLHTEGYTSGPLNERQMQLWGSMGYTGSWNERALAFWLGGALPAGTPLTQSEVTSYYTLDTDANDEKSGYSYSGGGVDPTWSVAGLTGNCSSWADTGQYRFGASNTYWDVGTHTTMSINVWVNPTDLSDIGGRYICQHYAGASDGFRFWMADGGAPTFRCWATGSVVKDATGPVLTAGAWNMITVVLDPSGAGTLTVYTNAVAGTPVAITGMDTARTTASTLSNSAASWKGLMEDLSMYYGAWTTDNITWLYNRGSGRSYSDYAA